MFLPWNAGQNHDLTEKFTSGVRERVGERKVLGPTVLPFLCVLADPKESWQRNRKRRITNMIGNLVASVSHVNRILTILGRASIFHGTTHG